jgi:hemolysin-activating ACP:hemolysin acyltransferase
MAVGQLRALLEPAISAGQFLVASHGNAGAAVLWALTDEKTDARLRTDLSRPFEIAPTEWRSGPHAWIVAAVGDQAMARQLVEMIQTTMLNGARLSARVAGPDGSPAILDFASRPPIPG